MHHDKNTSIKFVAEFVGEERETAPAAAPVRAAELRAAGVAVLWAGIDAAPADEGEAAGSSACVSNPGIWGAGWQARHNRTPKHEGLAGTRARFNRPLSKAPGKKIQPRALQPP